MSMLLIVQEKRSRTGTAGVVLPMLWLGILLVSALRGHCADDVNATVTATATVRPSLKLTLWTEPSATPSPLVKALTRRSASNATAADQKTSAGDAVPFVYTSVTLVSEVEVGTPPQRQRLVLDTGSELSWLHCSSSSAASFDARRSSTYRTVPCRSELCTVKGADLPIPPRCSSTRARAGGGGVCRFAQTYADGTSVEGDIATDIFAVGAGSAQVAFGCTGALVANTPGLLGLNKGALSLVSQLKATKFSMCMAAAGARGFLMIGDTASAVATRLQYTPMVTMGGSGSSWRPPNFDGGAYSVRLEGIKVGATLLPIPKSVFMPDHTGAGQTMLDSATHFSLLLGDAYTPLRAEFMRQNAHALGSPMSDFAYEGALDLCYSAPPAPAAATAVTLQLQSVDIVLDAKRVLFQLPGRPSVWCLSFGNADLLSLDANIIGNQHQQGLWLEFDLARARLGVAPGPCS